MNEQIKEVLNYEWGKAFINYLKRNNTYNEDDFKFEKLDIEMRMFRLGFKAGQEFALHEKAEVTHE